MNKWNTDNMPLQEGKIAIVTGANSGLGYYTAKGLLVKGAEVIMACRNVEKGEIAASEIVDEYPSAKLHIMHLDLSDLSSVKRFADSFLERFHKLDILINNAGLMAIPYAKTVDGFEMQFGVNHLGHFALVRHLFDILKSTPGARVVAVSSIAAKAGDFDFEDLNWEKKYRRWFAYGRSKLANLLFILELADKTSKRGIDITALAAHPGYADSNLLEKGPTMKGRKWLVKAGHLANKLVAQSTEMGALPTLYAATSEDVVQGGYYGPRGFAGMKGYPTRTYPNNKKITKDLQKKLWLNSEELTGVSFLSD